MEHLPAERLGPMFLLALTTALRPGEAAGVLWEDVDLEAGTIHVSHAVRLEKGRPVVVDALKTASSYRALKLPRPAVEAMRAHRARQARERLAAASWSDDRLVFATRVGTPLSPANVRRELRDVCRRAGVPEVLPNELRHTGASLMVDAGASLHEVADVMGHTTTRMLDATYRHRLRDTVDTAATVMDGLFDRASGAER
jgi:integrase